MRPAARALLMGSLITAIVTCAAVSPLFLAAAGRWWDTDWVRLANVGQAYGAASALFSALAFAGVAAGLLYQARQLRLQRVQATREKHDRLMALAADDPDTYGLMFGPAAAAKSPVELRRRFFCLMLLNYLRMSFENGTYSEAHLRAEALPKHFANATAREHWSLSRRQWLEDIGSRAYRRFARIVDDEYHRAVMAGPPTAERIAGSRAVTAPPRRGPTWKAAVAVAVGSAAIGWLLGRRP